MDKGVSFSSLLVVIFLAFIVPLVLSRFRRLRVPTVVGEIAAGILVGRSGLEWVQYGDSLLTLLSELGFVFLMFLAGMEIDFTNLGGLGKGGRGAARWSPIRLGIATLLLTLSLSACFGFGITRLGLAQNPWIMMLILSTTSLGVVMPILKERGLSGGVFGQSLLVSAMIADFATMLLVTVLVAILSHGITLNILLVGVLFVASFVFYRSATFFHKLKAVQLAIEELGHTPAKIKVRAAFTLMLVFVALSEILGTEVILGAFLAGAIVSLLRTPGDTELPEQLDAIGFGFFLPIFFIMVGVKLDLRALLDSPRAVLLVPLFLVAAVAVKSLPALVFRLRFSWREAWAAGALLSARLSLIIAVSAIGLRLGVISESVNTAIVLIAIITVTLSPLVFSWLIPERETSRRPFVVLGAGELGLQVAKRMSAYRENVVLLDHDATRVARAREHGYTAEAIGPDPQGPDLARHVEDAQALVCTALDTAWEFGICRTARQVYGLGHIVAQVEEPGELARFANLGIQTLNLAVDRASMLVMLARNPAAYSLMTRTDDDRDMREIVMSNGDHAGKSLREIWLPGDVLVLAVRREGDLIVPDGSTQLALGDYITLVGSVDDVELARQMLTA